MNQEDSEHNEVDGMKKGVDSTGEVMPHSIPPTDAAINAVDRECINYLSDTELKMLQRYSRIRKVFIKFITT